MSSVEDRIAPDALTAKRVSGAGLIGDIFNAQSGDRERNYDRVTPLFSRSARQLVLATIRMGWSRGPAQGGRMPDALFVNVVETLLGVKSDCLDRFPFTMSVPGNLGRAQAVPLGHEDHQRVAVAAP